MLVCGVDGTRTREKTVHNGQPFQLDPSTPPPNGIFELSRTEDDSETTDDELIRVIVEAVKIGAFNVARMLSRQLKTPLAKALPDADGQRPATTDPEPPLAPRLPPNGEPAASDEPVKPRPLDARAALGTLNE